MPFRLVYMYSRLDRFRYLDNLRKDRQWLPAESTDDKDIKSMQKWWGKLKQFEQ